MVPGKLIKPAGWAFTSGDAATRQFRCTGTSFDVIDPVFHLGVFTTLPAVQAGSSHLGASAGCTTPYPTQCERNITNCSKDVTLNPL
jgi:hypothetical protein